MGGNIRCTGLVCHPRMCTGTLSDDKINLVTFMENLTVLVTISDIGGISCQCCKGPGHSYVLLPTIQILMDPLSYWQANGSRIIKLLGQWIPHYLIDGLITTLFLLGQWIRHDLIGGPMYPLLWCIDPSLSYRLGNRSIINVRPMDPSLSNWFANR